MGRSEPHVDALADTLDRAQCDALGEWIDGIQDGNIAGPPDNDLMALANELWDAGNEAVSHSQSTAEAAGESEKPQIHGYQIHDLIGRGGMGLVYRATDQRLKRRVAIKVLPANVVGSERARKRFQIEVQAAAQLEHPAIVPVYAYGEYEGGLFYTMREIEGIDLAEKMRARTDSLTSDQSFGPVVDFSSTGYRRWVATIGKQLAEALAHSHEQLILHRDVKPANVLIDADGNAMLSDFGLARISEGSELTGANDVLGTVLYMSPEQTGGEGVMDGRTDVYSLGVTLYELLTGTTAVTESGIAAAWKQINDGRIQPLRSVNPAIEKDLETIILKSIAPEPSARYANATEMAGDLGRFLDVLPIHARRATLGLRLARWSRRNSRWVSALAIVASLLLAVIFGLTIYGAKTSSQYAATIRDKGAALFDQRGVELLELGDSRRAAMAFREAAGMAQNDEFRLRQLQR
ncbi:MAG: serine/threonine-protein kinase, partial [Planctomycetota bacterium]